MNTSAASLLDLLQLSDSALPIGAQSHSFGLETLVADGQIHVGNLYEFLDAYIHEAITIECVYCRAGYDLGAQSWTPPTGQALCIEQWLLLNRRLAALRPAQETRLAGEVLGRRFLSLVVDVSNEPAPALALQACKTHGVGCHHAPAFGLAGGALGLGVEAVTPAYAQQGVSTLLAAAQKLLPIGQNAVMRMRWQLKAALAQAVDQSRDWYARQIWAAGFAPLVELASMRHPNSPVRLFIS